MKIRGSVVSSSFVFPHPPKDEKKKKSMPQWGSPNKAVSQYLSGGTPIQGGQNPLARRGHCTRNLERIRRPPAIRPSYGCGTPPLGLVRCWKSVACQKKISKTKCAIYTRENSNQDQFLVNTLGPSKSHAHRWLTSRKNGYYLDSDRHKERNIQFFFCVYRGV